MYNRGSFLNEEWTVLGWHMNPGESIFECAKREVMEEANIEIEHLRFLTILEDKINWYLSFYILAQYKSGRLYGNIDEKIESLKWVDIDNFPKELYWPFRRFFTGENIHWKNIYELLRDLK